MARPLPKWTMPAVAAVVLAVTGGVAAALWWWVDSQQWTDPAQKTTALLDVVKVASGIAVGGGGLFALYLAARRQRTQEKELAHTEQDAAARRVTDLYATSVEQLGSDKAPVRLGGLYALERLAQDNPTQRQTIVNVLCAYLRMPFDPPAPDSPAPAAVQEREVRVTAQRILAAHQRPGDSGHWSGLHLDLTGATLVDANFSSCHLHDATFVGTVFAGGYTMFLQTRFTGVASFGRAVFQTESFFHEAVFEGTVGFPMATFENHADFHSVRAEGAMTFTSAWVTSDTLAKDSTWPIGWKADPVAVAREGWPGMWRPFKKDRKDQSAG